MVSSRYFIERCRWYKTCSTVLMPHAKSSDFGSQILGADTYELCSVEIWMLSGKGIKNFNEIIFIFFFAFDINRMGPF